MILMILMIFSIKSILHQYNWNALFHQKKVFMHLNVLCFNMMDFGYLENGLLIILKPQIQSWEKKT